MTLEYAPFGSLYHAHAIMDVEDFPRTFGVGVSRLQPERRIAFTHAIAN
jgi:hypothetical protein